ncbi:ATP-dependent DNA helicase [Aphis craccivora]|uniref:ATP-dependent DNA helicase n=1 Tax=Aphis craccivora TaxID=307492 RepID=A0A6G0Y1M8_APHCR|nr:ATP-dependent DNA helicase [Aphis craccivora]
MGLPLKLVLKETAKYMVIANISTKEGIVNDAIRNLMKIIKIQFVGGKEVAKRVWIQATSAIGLCIDHFPVKPPICSLNQRFSSIVKDIKPLSCMSHNIKSLKNMKIVLMRTTSFAI